MSTLKIDLIDGSLKRTEDGYELTRVGIVSDIGGNANAVLTTALSASGMPAIGDAHPVLSYLICRDIEVRPVDAGKCEVQITYRSNTRAGGDPTDATIPVYSLRTSMVQETSNVDKDGNPNVFSYTGAPNEATPVTVLRPQTVISVRRRESGIKPLNVSTAVAGKVNSFAWQGGEIGEWLCTSFTAESLDGGESWDCQYEFELKKKRAVDSNAWEPTIAWNPIIVATDPKTDKPYGDATHDLAKVAEVNSYDSFDFRRLNI